MSLYARELPKSKNEMQFDGAPPSFPSLQSQIGVPNVSSVITFTDKTTAIELTAITGVAASPGIIGKWGTGSVTSSNFDVYVPAGGQRYFVVPTSIQGTSSISGANVANGLYPAISVKVQGPNASASVLSIEY